MISSSQPGGGSESPPPWETARPARGRRTHRPSGTGWPIALALIVAFWLGGFAVSNLRSTRFSGPVTTLFPALGGDRINDSSVDAAWDIVRSQYVVRGVDSSKGTAGAEAGIVQYLHDSFNDRFTAYFTANQYRSLTDSLNGRRAASIGVELGARCAGGALCAANAQPSVVAVLAVLHNQPAEKAGVRRGDVIVSVDGTKLTSLGADPNSQINNAKPLLDQAAGSQHALVVQRGAQAVTLMVTDQDLKIPSVFSMRFGNVVDIQVTGFDDKTGSDVRQQLQDALNSGATAIVLDLRHNPGGFVSEAQTAASQFLKKSPNVQDVVVRRGRLDPSGGADSAQQVTHDSITDDGGIAATQPMAVLVDGESASAAEIVTAALHDYKRATVVGEKTFGKGSVQQDFSLPDGSDLHLTVEKWFGPAGESIDGTGIGPDRTVALQNEDQRFRLDAQAGDATGDAQLQVALAVASGHGG